MPGSDTRFDPLTYKPRQHGRCQSRLNDFFHQTMNPKAATEMWYSAVIRSHSTHGDETARDFSRKVADWRRMSLWSSYDLCTKRLHVLVLGWPPALRDSFQSIFQGGHGSLLRRHPMVVHAYFARHILLYTYDFWQEFSGPLYRLASITRYSWVFT